MANALRAPCCDSPRTPRTYPCAQYTTSNHPTLFPHSQEITHCKTELACGKGGASTTCQLLLQRRALRNSLPLSPEASAMRSWNSQLIVAITIGSLQKRHRGREVGIAVAPTHLQPRSVEASLRKKPGRRPECPEAEVPSLDLAVNVSAHRRIVTLAKATTSCRPHLSLYSRRFNHGASRDGDTSGPNPPKRLTPSTQPQNPES